MIFIELETEGLMLKKQYTYLVAGTKNCISIKVNLDRHWQGLEVFAVCYRDNKEYPYAITNGECLIADMAIISTSGEFKLKLLGTTADGNVVMTTNIVTVYINDNKFSGAEGGELEYPTSDYLAEVLAGSKKQADRAQGYAEQAEQIKADTQSIADTAAGNLDKIVQAGQQAMSDAVANVNRVAGDAKVDINSAVQAGKDDLAGAVAGSKAEVDTAVTDAKNALQEQGKQAIAEVNAAADKAKTDMDTAVQNATAQADRAQGYADSVKDVEQELRADNARLTTDLKQANRRISVLYDLGKGITHRYETDNDTAYSKDIPRGVKLMDVKMAGGKSVVGNNQTLLRDFDKEVNGVHVKFDSAKSSITLTGTLTDINYSIPLFNNSIPITPRHKYYKQNQTTMKLSYRTLETADGDSSSWSAKNAAEILTAPDNAHFSMCYIYSDVNYPGPPVGTVLNETFSTLLIDLTQMFGAGNEPTLEQFQAMLTRPDYPYNAGTLVSADVTDVQVGDKVISLPNSISLKSAGSVYDSLEFYEADGKYYQKHTQRVGVVDLGTLTWVNNGNIDANVQYLSRSITERAHNQNAICARYPVVRDYTLVNCMILRDHDGGIAILSPITSTPEFTASLQGALLYYELATPIVTVTEVDNRFDAVDCNAGDKITFVGNSDYHLPIPNEEEYLISLNEVTA